MNLGRLQGTIRLLDHRAAVLLPRPNPCTAAVTSRSNFATTAILVKEPKRPAKDASGEIVPAAAAADVRPAGVTSQTSASPAQDPGASEGSSAAVVSPAGIPSPQTSKGNEPGQDTGGSKGNAAGHVTAGSKGERVRWEAGAGVVAIAGLVGAWLQGVEGPKRTSRVEQAQKDSHAEVARSFQQRRVDAVKERLTRRLDDSSVTSTAVGNLFPREDALAVVAVVAKNAGLYMICGPKGEGKSSLMQLLEASHPCIIRVDLQKDSMDLAVRDVAKAIGYSMEYTWQERAARAAGYGMPDLDAPQGIDAYKQLLMVFEQACKELRAEGALKDHVPVLVLDHANRPLPSLSVDKTLVYTTVEHGHRFANEGTASLVMVTSDPQQEHEAWTKAGGRDSLKPVRVPPFSAEHADELLARLIYARLHPTAKPPSVQDLAAIKAAYSCTLRFACGAVGTRARWLMTLLQLTGNAPVSDKELEQHGVRVDVTYFPFLPKELQTQGLRVDPTVWAAFVKLVTERMEALKPLLEVPDNFGLLPRLPPPSSEEDILAQRVLATDLALRDLLNAAAGSGTTVETPTASMPAFPAGVSVGMTWEALRDKYFSGHPEELRALCSAHVLFYNHGTRTLEFESELMRRVVTNWLSEPRHMARTQLLGKLQEWQAASVAKAEAKEMLELRTKASRDTNKASMAALDEAGKDLDRAVKRVRDLEDNISALRQKLTLTVQETPAETPAGQK